MKRFSLRNIECVIVMALVSGCGASGSGADSGSAAKTVSAGADANVVDSGSAADADKTVSGSVADADNTESADADASGVGTRGWTRQVINVDTSARTISGWITWRKYESLTEHLEKAESGSDLHSRMKYLSEQTAFPKYMKFLVDIYYDGKWWTGKEMYFKTGEFYVKGVRQSSDIWYSSDDFKEYYNKSGDTTYNFKNVTVVKK